MIVQFFIMIFGASAIWFVSRKEDWKRWGYILGMLGQPFWIYESYTNEQWGILLMTLVYAYSWMQGICNYWIFPSQGSGVPTMENKPEPPVSYNLKKTDPLPGEVFKYVPGYEGRYKVSNKGRMLTECLKKPKIMKTRILDNGLERVNLIVENKRKTFYVHRLVMYAFKGEESCNVIHRDGNKLNNELGNLKYSKETHFHQPENAPGCKKVKCTISNRIYDSIREASEKEEMNYGNLSRMLNGQIPNTTNLEYA